MRGSRSDTHATSQERMQTCACEQRVNIYEEHILIHAPEYDIASLYMVSFYCLVTKACARKPGAATRVERRRRERRTLLAGAAHELAGATRTRQTGLRAHAHTHTCARAVYKARTVAIVTAARVCACCAFTKQACAHMLRAAHAG
jgi:hypothetical protein